MKIEYNIEVASSRFKPYLDSGRSKTSVDRFTSDEFLKVFEKHGFSCDRDDSEKEVTAKIGKDYKTLVLPLDLIVSDVRHTSKCFQGRAGPW